MLRRYSKWLLVLFLLIGSQVYAQKTVSVRDALKKITKVFKTEFVYDPQVVETKTTKYNLDDLSGKSVEDVLKGVLYPNNLVFLYVKSNYYTIVEKDRIGEYQQTSASGKTTAEDVRTSSVSVTTTAQDRIKISGSVLDEKGAPIPSVTVSEKGTSNATMTSEDGRFVINVRSANAVLTFSSIGYATFEAAAKNDMTVTLLHENKELEQVVVIGYGTQKKADLTGSVGTVKTETNLKGRSATNVQELMAGAVPGFNVTKGSGAVGSGASLNIRGTSTMGGSSGVLVLIDGVQGNIYTLNPNDIESISVLKDAAAAAIYGSRAANGVMLITTKTAKGGMNQKPVVELNSTIGLQTPQFMLDFVGSEDYMRMWDQALVNDGKSPLYGDQGIADLKAGKYADNLWYKEIYKKSSIINNNYISVTGKQDYIAYRLSASYDYQDGTLPNNNYNRFIVRPDLTIQLAKNLTVGANIQLTQTAIEQPYAGTDNWQSQAARNAPIAFIKTPSGQYGQGGAMAANPIAGVNEGGYTKDQYKEFLGIFELNYTPITNWNIKANYSSYYFDDQTASRSKTYNLYNVDGTISSVQNTTNRIYQKSARNWRNILQLTTDYSFQYLKNNFKVLAGASSEYFKTSQFDASRENIPFDDLDQIDLGTTNKQNSGNASEVAVASFFARVNYDFDGKYLLQANIRADGSSRFAQGNRWGYFPAFSAGWNIHRESFFNIKWINQLKLRASWGMLGDADKTVLGYYPAATVLSFASNAYGINGSVVPGVWQGKAVDPNISWEKAAMTNIGIDATFLQNKLSFSAEYFINNRTDILNNTVVPIEFGLTGPVSNLYAMKNRGMEFQVGYNDRSGDFYWGADVNLSYSKNEVTDLKGAGPIISGNTYTAVGKRYQLPYGLVNQGLFQDQADATASGQGANVMPGNIKYKLHGAKFDAAADREILNEDVIPVNFGGNLRFGWKNIDFSTNFYGVSGNYRYMSGYEGWAFYLSQNARPLAKDAWTPTNPNASYPRLTIQNTSNDTRYSSYWLRKASYIKWQNAQVGYTFPRELLERAKIQSLRLFVSVQNIATITGYEGFDPEGGWYPLSRTYSFGVNVKF